MGKRRAISGQRLASTHVNIAAYRDTLLHDGLLEDLIDRRPHRLVGVEERLEQHLERPREAGRDRGVASLGDLEHQLLDVSAIERVLERGQLIEHDAEGPDVGLVIVGLAVADLG